MWRFHCLNVDLNGTIDIAASGKPATLATESWTNRWVPAWRAFTIPPSAVTVTENPSRRLQSNKRKRATAKATTSI